MQKGHRQRLRDRFVSGEESSRSEEALLELLLTYAIPQKDVQPLAAHLLSEHGNLSSLLEASMESLCQSSGVKENSAVLLKLVDWIRQHHGHSGIVREKFKPPIQTELFKDISADTDQQASGVAEPYRKRVIRRYGTEMFGKAVLKEAIQILPTLPDSESLDDIRSFLRIKLHFSAELTRKRYANYITRRMFPEGYADAPLRLFAKTYPNTKELQDVCFYRFLLSEPLEVDIIEELISNISKSMW